MIEIKENKGITLIALVITIITLLILAGVSIATLTGNNGVVNKTSQASLNTDIAELDEKVKIYKMGNENYNENFGDNSGEVSLINNGIVQSIYVKDTGREIWVIKDLNKLEYNKKRGNNGKNLENSVININNIYELDDVFFIDRTDDTLYYISKNNIYSVDGKQDILELKYEKVEAVTEDWEITTKNNEIYIEKYLGSEKNIVIPNFLNGKKIKGIGKYSSGRAWNYTIFDNSSNIETIVISDGISEIGDNCFYGLSEITELKLPESIEKIGSKAFDGCTKLEKVNIPKNVNTIGENAFSGPNLLSQMDVDGKNKNYILEDKILYNKDKTRIIRCLINSSVEEYIVSNNVTIVDRGAFCYCNNLKKIYISSSIKYIPQNAFYYCKNLSDVTIEEGITVIGQTSFYGCKSLKYIDLPETLNRLDYSPFGMAGLEKIVVPKLVLNIRADLCSGCPLSEGFYIETENVEDFTTGRIGNIGKDAIIYVKNEGIKNKIIEQIGFPEDRIKIYS